MRVRGVICQERPQRSLHHPHSLSFPPLSTIAGGDAGVVDSVLVIDTGTTPPSQCGDGKVQPGEACDDGNFAPNDGCSATCTVESAGANDTCPGAVIALSGTGADKRTASITGSTATVYGHTAGSCGGGSGKDAVYMVKPDVTGLLTAKVTSAFDSVLYARSAAPGASTRCAKSAAEAATRRCSSVTAKPDGTRRRGAVMSAFFLPVCGRCKRGPRGR